jgi:hypothetical protein
MNQAERNFGICLVHPAWGVQGHLGCHNDGDHYQVQTSTQTALLAPRHPKMKDVISLRCGHG